MGRKIGELAYEYLLLSRHSSGLGGSTRIMPLERSAYILLTRLSLDGPMSLGQLKDAFQLDVSTLHRQTTAMMRAGLVERIPDPDGGMARKFKVTETGARKLDEHRAMVRGGFDAVLAGWSEEDIAAFGHYLRRFNVSIEDRLGSPWPHPDLG